MSLYLLMNKHALLLPAISIHSINAGTASRSWIVFITLTAHEENVSQRGLEDRAGKQLHMRAKDFRRSGLVFHLSHVARMRRMHALISRKRLLCYFRPEFRPSNMDTDYVARMAVAEFYQGMVTRQILLSRGTMMIDNIGNEDACPRERAYRRQRLLHMNGEAGEYF